MDVSRRSSHEALLRVQGERWRDPRDVVAAWAAPLRPAGVLRPRASRGFWDLLERLSVTLLVSREYEHFVVGLSAAGGRPIVTYLNLPHPSGIAVDRRHRRVHVGATRNPNQVFTLAPARDEPGHPLVPVRTDFYPGSLYLHDLAIVGGHLVGNAVGQNAVVQFEREEAKRVWWPKCIETKGRPDFTVNHIQLNSVAAGATLEDSYFSASAAAPGRRRPGQVSFPVDGRGVIFDGRTREVAATGLTRPHSARLRRGTLWVDNSGYGETGVIENGRFVPVIRLPGWTRGLCFTGDVAFIGTSRVLPRFRAYAPGVQRETCGVHALEVSTGKLIASLTWSQGSQIFAVESIASNWSLGFAFGDAPPGRRGGRARELFFNYET